MSWTSWTIEMIRYYCYKKSSLKFMKNRSFQITNLYKKNYLLELDELLEEAERERRFLSLSTI